MTGTTCGCGGYCPKCKGIMWLILGILILINVYLLEWDWWTFIGAVLILKGLLAIAKPSCPCGKADVKKKK